MLIFFFFYSFLSVIKSLPRDPNSECTSHLTPVLLEHDSPSIRSKRNTTMLYFPSSGVFLLKTFTADATHSEALYSQGKSCIHTSRLQRATAAFIWSCASSLDKNRPVGFLLSSSFRVQQLLRKIFGSLAGKRFTMFSS